MIILKNTLSIESLKILILVVLSISIATFILIKILNSNALKYKSSVSKLLISITFTIIFITFLATDKRISNSSINRELNKIFKKYSTYLNTNRTNVIDDTKVQDNTLNSTSLEEASSPVEEASSPIEDACSNKSDKKNVYTYHRGIYDYFNSKSAIYVFLETHTFVSSEGSQLRYNSGLMTISISGKQLQLINLEILAFNQDVAIIKLMWIGEGSSFVTLTLDASIGSITDNDGSTYYAAS